MRDTPTLRLEPGFCNRCWDEFNGVVKDEEEYRREERERSKGRKDKGVDGLANRMGQINLSNNNHSPRQHYPQRPYGGDQPPPQRGPQRPPMPQRPQRPPHHNGNHRGGYDQAGYGQGGYDQGGYDDYGGNNGQQQHRQ